MPSATRTPRDQRRERTRQQLITATLELLRQEGIGAVSVSRVTRRVGVHHSLFYAHFKTVDECLAVAAGHVLAGLAPVDRAFLHEVLARSVSDEAALTRHFESMLERWLETRPFVELLLNHRLDQSALGRTLQPALAQMRDDFASELWIVAARVGVAPGHVVAVRRLADLFQHLFLWGLECLLSGREHDRGAVARSLAVVVFTQSRVAFGRMLIPTRDEVVAARFPPRRIQAIRQVMAAWRHAIAAGEEVFVSAFPSAELAVDGVMRAMAQHFLPELASAQSATVGYSITTGEGVVWRRFVIDRGDCMVDAVREGKAPRCTLHMTLCTLVEAVSGACTHSEAFGAGMLRVEGDVLFSSELLDWFFVP